MNKRTFLRQFAALGIGAPVMFPQLEKWVKAVEHLSPAETAADEDFWARIRSGYRLKPDYINLESGYYCIAPQETLENFIHHVRHVNYEGSHYMRTVRWTNKNAMAARLAELAGCPADELIITRNTTESLDLVIAGFPWEEGDEAVMAEQDYGAMLN
ncbi:MAG: aminotransferase class V-fold PLP-dependent enzyme, partial [Saprospiraceae bacterium]|nr:aminotransferase class V-fold PLP-dependent enzyme [Saprospiraceae bacterium]